MKPMMPLCLLFCLPATGFAGEYPWLSQAPSRTLASEIKPPDGFVRLPVEEDSFGSWLRNLPLHPEGKVVFLHNGQKKGNQNAHYRVLDVDTGKKDLQQCADAVMRLRAEFLYGSGRGEQIQFAFTNGFPAKWADWRAGRRPVVRGNRVSLGAGSRVSSDYQNFRKYLETVFIYAGSQSLSGELQKVQDPSGVALGDVFIQGGFPGHAVLVVDVAENDRGERVFLLVQSYMPAQDIHLLKNPGHPDSPWYHAKREGPLNTPEWRFRFSDLKRW